MVGCVMVMNGQQNASPGFSCIASEIACSTMGLKALEHGDSPALPCGLLVWRMRSLVTDAMGVGANIVGIPLAVHSPTSEMPKDMWGSMGPSVVCRALSPSERAL